MAISKETITEITNFGLNGASEIASKKVYKDLGEVDGRKLVYGICRYRQRVISLTGQPFLLSYTEQPVVAVVRESGLVPLVYDADVTALGEDLAVKVAKHLANCNRNEVAA